MALGLSQLEIAFQEECGDADCGNVLGIDKLFYQFPIGPGFTATVGPRVGQEDMLALWPSAYRSDTILNVLTVNGDPAAYSKNLGPGAGIWWKQNALSTSANYVAANGDCADSSQGGIGTAGSALQVACNWPMETNGRLITMAMPTPMPLAWVAICSPAAKLGGGPARVCHRPDRIAVG